MASLSFLSIRPRTGKIAPLAIFVVAFAVLALCGCNEISEITADRPRHSFVGKYPIQIVCTTGMVADLVRHTGGSHVAVTQLMGEGVDPHLYKISTGDVAALIEADMVVYSGLHLEGKMATVFDRLNRRKPTVPVTASIPHERLIEVTAGQHDPHVWFDVGLWASTLNTVAESLAGFDPSHASEYRDHARRYQSELLELHARCRERLASIPERRRVLVTAHDAFHYFGRAYDLEVMALQGISTESEAGVREVNELVEFIVDRAIKAVFVESSVSDANLTALLEGCRARGHSVRIGGELFSDAMGKAGTPEGTYIGMVRHNVETIAAALR